MCIRFIFSTVCDGEKRQKEHFFANVIVNLEKTEVCEKNTTTEKQSKKIIVL